MQLLTYKDQSNNEKVTEAETSIRAMIEWWIDEYIESKRIAPEIVRQACFHLMYSKNEELRIQWHDFLRGPKLQRIREDHFGKKYKELKEKWKKNGTPTTVFRNYTIKDTLTDMKYDVLCVGNYDYEKEKDVYKDSLVITTIRNPLLYKHIMDDCKNKSIISYTRHE